MSRRSTTLRRLGAPRGVTRFVIVQPSFYGSDNTLLLESLDALGGDGRGVAVVDPAAPQATLDDLARRGVRGLRLNLYSSAGRADARPLQRNLCGARRGRAADALARRGDRVARRSGAATPICLRGSPVPVVIDHYGVYGDATPESADARRLLELLRLPHVWMKLSAPYRVSADPLATRPDRRWLDAILSLRRGALRLGQRLAAHAAARGARGSRRGRALSRAVLRAPGRRFPRRRSARTRSPTASCATIRRGFTNSRPSGRGYASARRADLEFEKSRLGRTVHAPSILRHRAGHRRAASRRSPHPRSNIRAAPCAWSCRLPRAAPATSSRACWRTGSRKRSGNRSWWRTARARPARSGRRRSLSAAPDGHTLLVGQTGEMAINQHWSKGLGYDPVADFQPVALATVVPLALVVPGKASYSTVAEMLAAAKTRGLVVRIGGRGDAGTLLRRSCSSCAPRAT